MIVRRTASELLSHARVALKKQPLVHRSQAPGPTWLQVRGLRHYQEKTVRLMYWRSRSFDAVKYPERRRSDFYDWNYRSEIFAFSRRLQENLSEDTLRCIFAQPSYVESLKVTQAESNLPDLNLKSNEELVGRGDTLLDECIKPYLRYTFGLLPEEGIAAITSYLKSEAVMADIAKWIGCPDLVLSTEHRPSQSTLKKTIFALVGGIENDLGVDRARLFVIDMIISYLNDKDILDDIWIIPNPRETLKLILKNSSLPEYEPRIMFQTGVKTLESCHVVGLYVNQKLIGSSPGETLDIAEDCAALESFKEMFDLKDSRQPYVYGALAAGVDYSAYTRENTAIANYRINFTH